MTDHRDGFVRAIGIALLAALVAGCAPRATVVLLPEKDGRQTAVTVTQGERKIVLDEPYAAVKQGAFGTTTAYKSDPKEVEALAGPALAAQPARPASFTLYFVEGKDEFTDESMRVVDTVFAEIAKRPLPDVVVVGHTDLTGTDQINDPLGQRRADFVKRQLVDRGVPAGNIEAISRGMRDPVVPTARGVAEPRNRRVEIVVR
jgi:outer membrane protein OmpA-like peptidoglycan-associated protein